MEGKPRKLSFWELVKIFTKPRHDHPGRKSGCPWRRGCYSGKVTRKR